MKNQVSVEQRFTFLAALGANIDWDQFHPDQIQALIRDPGNMEGTAFLKNRGRLVYGSPPVLQLLDSFDPAEFSKNLTFWRGPKNGKGLEGEVEVYEPTDLKEFSADRLQFDHFLTDKDGDVIGGEVKLDRAKDSKKILLGGRTCLTLWRDWQTNKENSVLEWLRKNRSITWIDFPGVVLRDSDGDRCILYLYFDGRAWNWHYGWLDSDWRRNNPSAVLEQVS